MKEKHGERIDLHWDSDPYGSEPEYIKGHVTEQEARDALNRWETGAGDGPMTICHLYARWCSARGDSDYDMELRTYSTPQRGTFKLTEVRPNVVLSRAAENPDTAME